MRICIIQSSYIPWKGFFDLLDRCDEYVVFDSVQYVKGHWHNRNRIKTPSGTKWLTIPVITSGRFRQPIRDVEIARPWAERHWRILELNYKRAAFFEQVAPAVKGWYERAERQSRLTDVNEIFLRGIAGMLGLKTRITRDSVYPGDGLLVERLRNILQSAGADRYLSGPSARVYLDESKLVTAGITPEWMSYEGYPEYSQFHGNFEHEVTVLDLLFHAGTEVSRYFRCGRILTTDAIGPHES